jgi:hypothetical protein
MGMYNIVPKIYVPNQSTDQVVIPAYGCARTSQLGQLVPQTPEYISYQTANQASIYF